MFLPLLNAVSAFAWHRGTMGVERRKDEREEQMTHRSRREMVGPKEIIPALHSIKCC